MSDVLLEAVGLTAGRSGMPVVRGVDLAVRAGEVVLLLGPNGAGKTTTLLTLAGVLRPLAGRVHVLGSEGLPVHRAVRQGMGFVPDDRGLFPGLTVTENLRVGGRTAPRGRADEVLEWFPALRPLRARRCGLLFGGEQQMLAVAKTLMGRRGS